MYSTSKKQDIQIVYDYIVTVQPKCMSATGLLDH